MENFFDVSFDASKGVVTKGIEFILLHKIVLFIFLADFVDSKEIVNHCHLLILVLGSGKRNRMKEKKEKNLGIFFFSRFDSSSMVLGVERIHWYGTWGTRNWNNNVDIAPNSSVFIWRGRGFVFFLVRRRSWVDQI